MRARKDDKLVQIGDRQVTLNTTDFRALENIVNAGGTLLVPAPSRELYGRLARAKLVKIGWDYEAGWPRVTASLTADGRRAISLEAVS